VAKYILADLIRVRTLRRDKIERELVAAKGRLDDAEKQVPLREKELEDYRKWVDAEIDRLYDEVLRKDVHRGAIDDLGTVVRSMRAKELDYVKRLQDAKDDLKKAQEELEAKKKELDGAQRDIEKLSSHREQWTAEQTKLDEFLADRELEEAIVHKNQGEKNSADEIFTGA
jgi:chromosome segregation ATPase